MKNEINKIVNEHIQNISSLDDNYYKEVERAINAQIESIKNGGKVLIAGNGGSASDAQHFAGEFVGRFMLERKAMPAISLSTDTSVLTCLGNDYGYDSVFERQVEALGKKGDIFIGISTSGNSNNIIKAIIKAKDLGMTTIGLLGKDGGKLASMCDINLLVPFKQTPRVQEAHIMTIHIMCEIIEKALM